MQSVLVSKAASSMSERSAALSDAFGRERLVCGGNWPVASLNGDYQGWREQLRLHR